MTRNIVIALCLSCLVPSIADAGRYRVDDFAVAYRIQVYETFRYDRLEYDRRLKLGKEVERLSWETTDQDAHALLKAWFVEATNACQPQVRGPLPALPNIDEHVAREVARKKAKEATRLEKRARLAEQIAAAEKADGIKEEDEGQGLFERLSRLVGLGGGSSSSSSGGDDWQPDVPAFPGNGATVKESSRPQVAQPSRPVKPEVTADQTEDAFDLFADQGDDSDDWAETDVTEVAKAPSTELQPTATQSPAVPADEDTLLLNARIAGHNLSLDGIQPRLAAAWASDGTKLASLLARLARLIETHQELKMLSEDAAPEQRAQLIDLDPTEHLLLEVIRQLQSFEPTVSEGDGEPVVSTETLEEWRDQFETLHAIYF